MEIGCDVLTAVMVRSTGSCTSEKVLRFGGIYRLHPLIRRVGEARKAGDRLSSIFDPEYEDDTFFRNVWFSPKYATL
jgi:hypothetical protein